MRKQMAKNEKKAEALTDVGQIEEITALLKKMIGPDVDLGATLKFDYEGAGVVFIDGSRVPHDIHNRDEPADCTVTLASDIHLKMLRMQLDQTSAFTRGLMRISGDVGVAVRLRPLILKNLR